jgi:hypothetical protein
MAFHPTMRACRVLLFSLAAFFSGCVIPTSPESANTGSFGGRFFFSDYYLAKPPIPYAHYDGTFMSDRHEYEYFDTTGRDTAIVQYSSQAFLYNKLGDIIEIPSGSVGVGVNGVNITYQRYYGYDTSLDLAFPTPITWTLKGDSYFSSFSHSISTEGPITYASPSVVDSQSASKGFALSYAAPGADIVTVTLDYWGPAVFRRDTSHTISDGYQYQQFSIPNTGQCIIPPFVADTLEYRSFNPNNVDISIAWARGDTLHVGSKCYGFVTECVRTRTYNLRP